MKIGLVIENFAPQRGGAEQWTYQFARWLERERHQVHLLIRTLDVAPAASSMRVHRLSTARSRLEFAALVERLLPSLQLDVVHDMGHGWRCDVLQPHGGSRRAAFRQNQLLEPEWKRPLKQFCQQLLPRYREFEQLMARQYESSTCIVLAVSEMVAQDLRSLHGLPDARIRRIYNGVDCRRFSPDNRRLCRETVRRQLEIEERDVVLLLVAHNLKLKGLPTLIRSLASLRSSGPRVRLLVVGGKRLRVFDRLAQRYGVADRVTLTGGVSDTAPYFASADIYVHPTYYDPCSLVALEALASGLPVVTSRFNGVSELIEHGKSGHVLDDPSDHDELAQAVEPLLTRRVREEMGENARRLAEAHSLQQNFAQVVQLYDEILSSGRRAA